MKINIHFWPYLAQLFLEWELLHTKFVEKIKTHFVFGTFFFPKILLFVIQYGKIFWRAGEVTDENMVQAHVTLGN